MEIEKSGSIQAEIIQNLVVDYTFFEKSEGLDKFLGDVEIGMISYYKLFEICNLHFYKLDKPILLEVPDTFSCCNEFVSQNLNFHIPYNSILHFSFVWIFLNLFFSFSRSTFSFSGSTFSGSSPSS